MFEIEGYFAGLAEGTILEAKLSEIDFLTLQGVLDVILQLTSEPTLHKKSLRKITNPLGKVLFKWSQCQEGWRTCVGLLDGLLEGPGHQYLTMEGVDDALVEASLMEGLSPG